MPEQRRPIKVVIPEDKHFRSVPPGGAEPQFFGAVDDGLFSRINSELDVIEKVFNASTSEMDPLPTVARVKLKRKALAKSHRPIELFKETTCPVIGGEGFGELLVSVNKQG